MKKHLKSVYGFGEFRDCQQDVIDDVLNKKDSIVIFPTGGGKSLCYQFPATYLNKKSRAPSKQQGNLVHGNFPPREYRSYKIDQTKSALSPAYIKCDI